MKYLYSLMVTDSLGVPLSTNTCLLINSSMMILSVQSDTHVIKAHSKVIKHCKRHCLNY